LNSFLAAEPLKLAEGPGLPIGMDIREVHGQLLYVFSQELNQLINETDKLVST